MKVNKHRRTTAEVLASITRAVISPDCCSGVRQFGAIIVPSADALMCEMSTRFADRSGSLLERSCKKSAMKQRQLQLSSGRASTAFRRASSPAKRLWKNGEKER